MPDRWYKNFFGEEYWNLAARQYPDSVISAEIECLSRLLTERAPGKRVVDLGCGIGHHAIGLAKQGFQVTAVDVSPWALEVAAKRAASSNVEVAWKRVDLLTAGSWRLGEVDAAICVRSCGWGSDVNQRALLREVRRHLVPQGILIMLQPEAAAVLGALAESIEVAIAETRYTIKQRYDPLTGRVRRRIAVSSGEASRVLLQDQRLYSTVELSALVRSSGFRVLSLDNFTPAVTGVKNCLSIRLVAANVALAPDALAVATWRTPVSPGFELRYAPDETEWLTPTPVDLWKEANRCDRDASDAIGHYPVDDPYGAERGAAVAAKHFDCPVPQASLTFGSGVTSLLQGLAGLADQGLIIAPGLVHPDLEAWAMGAGCEVRLLDDQPTAERMITEIRSSAPTVVHFDRPDFVGRLLPLEDVRAICEAAWEIGAFVLIDESPASCLGPASSAVQVAHQVHNLVVLRGLTKVYSCGGLRVAFSIASDRVAARVRELVPPLQVSEPAYQAVLRLLAAGDIFERLRARVAAVKPKMVAALQARSLEVLPGHPDVSWLVVSDRQQHASALLQRLGIRGLHPAPLPGQLKQRELLHLSVPLSDERIGTFEKLLAQPDAALT